ncbi:MAG: trigger factor [Candidatus Binatia bacterium]
MDETQVTVEEIGATRRRLDVEVPVETVAAEMNRAFGRVQRHAHVKGFRPGRVPRAVLEKYFGDQVRADVLSHLIEHSYSDALSRVGLRPVGPPEIVPENIEAGRPLRYSATVDIWPEIEIREIDGLPARRSRREVGEPQVDRAIEHLRESLAELRPVEVREEVLEGDFAAIDYAASVDDVPLPEGKRENRLVEVGKNTVPAEIDQALRGMKIGDSRSVRVAFPAEHPDAQVAGKTVRFDVTLRGIREKILPVADDDLAKEHGECSTLEELRVRLRERIAASFRAEADAEVREQLVDEILRRNPFEAPASLVERQTDALLQDLSSRFGREAGALQADPERLAKLRQELRPRAERQVRAVLALDTVATRLAIEVADEDVESRIAETAAQANQPLEKVRSAYGEPGAREDLRRRIARERALECVVASARIEEVDVSDDDVARTSEKG